MDLLTTYTHDSGPQAITAPPLITTIHSLFQPAVFSPAVPPTYGTARSLSSVPYFAKSETESQVLPSTETRFIVSLVFNLQASTKSFKAGAN
jgi:hypothetical protein